MPKHFSQQMLLIRCLLRKKKLCSHFTTYLCFSFSFSGATLKRVKSETQHDAIASLSGKRSLFK